MIEIDGSYGEGGGQVLRTALTLSALTGQSTRIRNIRAGRRNPGLAPQHLTGVLAVARLTGAKLRGAEIGSTEILFEAGPPRSPDHRYEFDVRDVARGGSAGSVTLLFQTLLLPLAFSGRDVEVVLKGGTHVAWSPPFDYIARVYLPVLSRMGLQTDCHLDAWGFYPVGGGQVSARIGGLGGPESKVLGPLTLTDRGGLEKISGRAVVSNLPERIADRMSARANDVLQKLGVEIEISTHRVSGAGPGAGIFLIAEYENTTAGFSGLGRKGLPAEEVADDACRDLNAFHESGSPIDMHLADQLVLPMALASGRSEMAVCRITQHLLTNVHIIRQFVPAKIDIEGGESEPGVIVVEGSGKHIDHLSVGDS
ncbi:MAG: RNA 3'-phosphate cyclase [Candidatus Latescibacterota bacterium]|nr:MAG: RNA 3'-phosphate cyclase [Candidatus Latescibacterota bacterium]